MFSELEKAQPLLSSGVLTYWSWENTVSWWKLNFNINWFPCATLTLADSAPYDKCYRQYSSFFILRIKPAIFK